MSSETLDMAEDAFDASPNKQTAADLLAAAQEYWTDGMVGNETFNAAVVKVQGWLRTGVEAWDKDVMAAAEDCRLHLEPWVRGLTVGRSDEHKHKALLKVLNAIPRWIEPKSRMVLSLFEEELLARVRKAHLDGVEVSGWATGEQLEAWDSLLTADLISIDIEGVARPIELGDDFVVVLYDGNGDLCFQQTKAKTARLAVNVALGQLEQSHRTCQETHEGFDPTEYEVKYIFPGKIGMCVAYETMLEG